MLISERGNSRSAKVFQEKNSFFITSKGIWNNETILVNEAGLFEAGFKQDTWIKNQYHYASKKQVLQMLWLNEEQRLLVVDQNEVHLSLKVLTAGRGVELIHQPEIDLKVCYLAWYFFEPIVSRISILESLGISNCG
jgi:hypothetical protein